jgi:hypothetical protein
MENLEKGQVWEKKVAKLLARQLVTAKSLSSNPNITQKLKINGLHQQRNGQHTVARQKNYIIVGGERTRWLT